MLMPVGRAKNKSKALLVVLLADRGRNGEVVKIRGEETVEVERVSASRSSISYHRTETSMVSFDIKGAI